MQAGGLSAPQKVGRLPPKSYAAQWILESKWWPTCLCQDALWVHSVQFTHCCMKQVAPSLKMKIDVPPPEKPKRTHGEWVKAQDLNHFWRSLLARLREHSRLVEGHPCRPHGAQSFQKGRVHVAPCHGRTENWSPLSTFLLLRGLCTTSSLQGTQAASSVRRIRVAAASGSWWGSLCSGRQGC